MKTKTLLIAAAMLLCLSAASFAQQIYSVSSTPITTVIKTGNAELAGDITFTTTNAVTAVAGTISIQYGGSNVIITNLFDNIKVTLDTGTGPANYTGLQVDKPASSYSVPSLLVIDVPAGMPAGAISVSRVRVQINGTNLTSLTASISAFGNKIEAGQTLVTVINGVGDGIVSASTTTVSTLPNIGINPVPTDFTSNVIAGTNTPVGSLAPNINAVNGTFVDNVSGPRYVGINVKEGFNAAFSKGVGVRITISATPPKGVSFSFPATATSYTSTGTAINSNWVRGGSTSWTLSPSTTTIDSTSTSSSSLQIYYYVASDSNTGPTNIEYLEIPVTVNSVTGSETFPLAAKAFTYTVTLAPVRDGLDSDGVPRTVGVPGVGNTSDSPRFAAAEIAAATPLASIGGGSTTLFIPYGYASKTAGDFNTAMSVSNTTEDPGTAILGFAGAVPQSGPITFYLFPTDTTLPMFSYKTVAGSPGSGLDASGNIASGGTYIVFLSQIFPLATPPTGSTATLGNTFIGYVMIVCNFTNGHGLFTISNFTTLTAQSSLMPVLSDRSVFPEK